MSNHAPDVKHIARTARCFVREIEDNVNETSEGNTRVHIYFITLGERKRTKTERKRKNQYFNSRHCIISTIIFDEYLKKKKEEEKKKKRKTERKEKEKEDSLPS